MVTRAMFDEIRILKRKILRLEEIKRSGIQSTICTILLEQYQKDFEALWDLMYLCFEDVDFFVRKVVELHYYYGLSAEEISEYYFRGTKSPINVKKVLSEFFEDLKRKNENGLPLLFGKSENK